MERTLNMPHKIKTAHLGHLPKTVFKENDICGVSFKDIENSNLMLAISHTHPKMLQKFYKFLHKISDPDFIPLLKDSGADALRMINIIVATAESVRIGHEGRRYSHEKIKQFFERSGIKTNYTAPISAYHIKNRTSKIEKRLFTSTLGVNMSYKELRCHLSNAAKVLRNEKLRQYANRERTAQHINPIKLGELHMSEHYHNLLSKFFIKNPQFLSAASNNPLSATLPYGTVPINAELLKAIDVFSF